MKKRLPQPYPVLSEKTILTRLKKSKESRLNTTKENKAEAITWLQGAKDYLTIAKKSTKINKIASLHNWCISSEKILKSFGLLSGSISPKDIKHHIGHNTPRVIIKMMDKYGDSILIANILNQQMIDRFSELSQYLQRRDKRTRKFFYHNDIRNVPNDMLHELIEFCNKPDSEIKKEISAKQLVEDMKQNHNKIRMFDILNSHLSILSDDAKERIFQTVLDVIPLEQILAYPRLMIISMISSSFFEPSRYPEDYQEYFKNEPNILTYLDLLFKANDKLISACENISKRVEVSKQ